MEVFKKVGRGGAGNFYSKKDVEDTVNKVDIESQTPFTDNAKPTSTQPPSEYIHSGRGGAGNWIKPADLQSQGLTQNTAGNDPTSTAPITAKKAVGQSKPAYRGGRGGAGNYIDPAGDEMRAKEEEERKRREAEERVERDVEAGLAKPAKAYGGYAGGSFEMK